MTINLDSAAGRDVLLDLVRTVGAVVANLPLPVEEAALLAQRPGLVLTKVENAGPELCAVARSGLMSITGIPDQAPVVLGSHVAMAIPGLYAAVSTALGLLNQELTGCGATQTVSVRESLESMVEQAMLEYTMTGAGTERRGGRGQVTAVSGALPAKDGFWVMSLGGDGTGRWSAFVSWMQDPVLMGDPTLKDEMGRQEKRDLIQDRLYAWSRNFTRAELVTGVQGLQIPSSPVSTPLDLVDDPQLLGRGFLSMLELPIFGPMAFPHGPIATTLGRQIRPAPRLGEHNAEILSELGYSAADHRTLVEAGAV